MLNFYPEEVAEKLHQMAELSGEHGYIQVSKQSLRELANKLTGGLPRPGPTSEDPALRGLESIIIRGNIFWFKTKTIDYSVWIGLYDMGWRPARFPVPAVA